MYELTPRTPLMPLTPRTLTPPVRTAIAVLTAGMVVKSWRRLMLSHPVRGIVMVAAAGVAAVAAAWEWRDRCATDRINRTT